MSTRNVSASERMSGERGVQNKKEKEVRRSRFHNHFGRATLWLYKSRKTDTAGALVYEKKKGAVNNLLKLT